MDPDPAQNLNADLHPDPGRQLHANPDLEPDLSVNKVLIILIMNISPFIFFL
jgi:hypothetical protein